MKVLKFGGTSVGSANGFKQVLKIIQNNLINHQKILIVCSAMNAVTNKLQESGKLAETGNIDYLSIVQEIEDTHLAIIHSLISTTKQDWIITQIKTLIHELEDILHGIFLLKEMSLHCEDIVLSFGERLSCNIIAVYLQQYSINAKFVDSRTLIKTNANFGNATVDFEISNDNLQKFILNLDYIPIITGYIASTIDNQTTTLGRGGSDYSASIIGAGINAQLIEIWTDVDGIMTADPRIVKNAFSVSNITYCEAIELSHFGAKIIYTPTLYPVFQKNIPLWVKNTFNHKHPGTLVSNDTTDHNYIIKAISSIDQVSILNINGQNITELLEWLLNLISQKGINVLLVTQSFSKHSVCIVVATSIATITENIINQKLESKINIGTVDKTIAKPNFSIISIIGDKIHKNPTIAKKFFQELDKNGITIASIAQNHTELNISVIIKSKQLHKALNITHEAFFNSKL